MFSTSELGSGRGRGWREEGGTSDIFLDASSQGPSARRSVRPSVGDAFSRIRGGDDG